MTSPATPVADPPVEATVPAAEPVAAPQIEKPGLGSLADAFRSAGTASLKERKATTRRSEKATSEESTPADAAASKSDDAKAEGAPDTQEPAKAGAPKAEGEPSRRGAAAKISDQQAEIDRLVAEREAERSRAAEHASKLQELTAKQEAARKTVLERIGSDADFERLQTRRIRREPMSYEDDERLDAMLDYREHASTLWEMTDQAHRVGIAQGLGTLVEQLGLDKKTAFGADLPGLVAHVNERAEARVRAETADEIATLKKTHTERVAELETELKGLRTRAKATPAPTVGGTSAPAGDLPADGSSPTSFFAAGIRNRPPQRAGGQSSRRAS